MIIQNINRLILIWRNFITNSHWPFPSGNHQIPSIVFPHVGFFSQITINPKYQSYIFGVTTAWNYALIIVTNIKYPFIASYMCQVPHSSAFPLLVHNQSRHRPKVSFVHNLIPQCQSNFLFSTFKPCFMISHPNKKPSWSQSGNLTAAWAPLSPTGWLSCSLNGQFSHHRHHHHHNDKQPRYYLFLSVNMLGADPASHLSTGVHQVRVFSVGFDFSTTNHHLSGQRPK